MSINPTPPPLNYRTAYSQERRPIFSVSTCVAGFLVLGFFTVAFCFIVPKFEQIFRNFGTKLPPVTQSLLNVSRWFNNSYGWAVLWPLPIGLGFIVPLLSSRNPLAIDAGRRRWIVRIFPMLIALLLMAVIVLLVILGLFLPMVSLITAVSSPKK